MFLLDRSQLSALSKILPKRIDGMEGNAYAKCGGELKLLENGSL